MNIIPFEELHITTMTLIMTLSGSAQTDIAFQLLPITQIMIQQTRESSKCKLPHCDIPGSILSMRYRDNIRGIVRNKSNPFKNAVTIDVSTKKKNINLKLSAFTIQMCGASSREDGVEAATHVINHLKNIQQILYRIEDNPEGALSAIAWVKDITRGESCQKPTWINKPCGNTILRIYHPVPDHLITKPYILIPPELDQYIVYFLLSLCHDFIYHGDLCQKLDYIPRITAVIDEPLEITNVDEAMVNYNYSLGFEVDRARLDELIDGVSGFISRFNNALATSTTIELPYERNEIIIKRRKNKIPHHTFLVYKSGSVTQSGPGGKIMEEAYYLFMNTISQIQSEIEYHPPN